MSEQVIQHRWRKSSYSGSGSECVEVDTPPFESVSIRDSKDPNGPILIYSGPEWVSFLEALRSDRLTRICLAYCPAANTKVLTVHTM
jgi:hypothetical protein